MSDGLAPETLMVKALRATASARILLDAGDVDGACSRAYYAMFDAARAALLAANAPVPQDIGKTHGGLISAFSFHLVKDGPVSSDLGKKFNRALEIRLVADYKGESVELSDARELIEQAEMFVEAMRIEFMPEFKIEPNNGLG